MNRADTAPRVRINTEIVPEHLCALIGNAGFDGIRKFFENPNIQAKFATWLENRNHGMPLMPKEQSLKGGTE